MPNIPLDNLRRAQIIDLLREYPGLSTVEMAERLKTTPRMIQGALAAMQYDGILRCSRKRKMPGTWELTPAYLKQIDDNLAPPIRRDFKDGPPYTCPELRPFTGRPGAMDAYRLPSRGF